jgi:hypothetical protein
VPNFRTLPSIEMARKARNTSGRDGVSLCYVNWQHQTVSQWHDSTRTQRPASVEPRKSVNTGAVAGLDEDRGVELLVVVVTAKKVSGGDLTNGEILHNRRYSRRYSTRHILRHTDAVSRRADRRVDQDLSPIKKRSSSGRSRCASAQRRPDRSYRGAENCNMNATAAQRVSDSRLHASTRRFGRSPDPSPRSRSYRSAGSKN